MNQSFASSCNCIEQLPFARLVLSLSDGLLKLFLEFFATFTSCGSDDDNNNSTYYRFLRPKSPVKIGSS